MGTPLRNCICWRYVRFTNGDDGFHRKLRHIALFLQQHWRAEGAVLLLYFLSFLLVGVYGSFLTGDIFNLFVFFEVMLISSYALISLGGTKLQLRETAKYLLINIVSSTLFVAAVAYLYAAVGTLNMAHLSQRIAEAGQGGILNVIAVLF